MDFDSERRGPLKSLSFQPAANKNKKNDHISHLKKAGVDENTEFIDFISRKHFKKIYRLLLRLLPFTNIPENYTEKLFTHTTFLIEVLLNAWKEEIQSITLPRFYFLIKELIVRRLFHNWFASFLFIYLLSRNPSHA